jgi:hypothetical protein
MQYRESTFIPKAEEKLDSNVRERLEESAAHYGIPNVSELTDKELTAQVVANERNIFDVLPPEIIYTGLILPYIDDYEYISNLCSTPGFREICRQVTVPVGKKQTPVNLWFYASGRLAKCLVYQWLYFIGKGKELTISTYLDRPGKQKWPLPPYDSASLSTMLTVLNSLGTATKIPAQSAYARSYRTPAMPSRIGPYMPGVHQGLVSLQTNPGPPFARDERWIVHEVGEYNAPSIEDPTVQPKLPQFASPYYLKYMESEDFANFILAQVENDYDVYAKQVRDEQGIGNKACEQMWLPDLMDIYFFAKQKVDMRNPTILVYATTRTMVPPIRSKPSTYISQRDKPTWLKTQQRRPDQPFS